MQDDMYAKIQRIKVVMLCNKNKEVAALFAENLQKQCSSAIFTISLFCTNVYFFQCAVGNIF